MVERGPYRPPGGVAIGWRQTQTRHGACFSTYGSVAPTVVRASGAEAILRGAAVGAEALERAGAALASELAPIDDVRSTAAYRRQIAVNLLGEFLARLRLGP